MVIVKLALNYLLNFVILLIFVRCILSWIPGLYNKFVGFVYNLTDPLLLPVQKLIYKIMGGRSMQIDLSPIVVYLIIEYVIRPLIFMI